MPLDLYRIIDTLLEERNRIDRAIRSLEAATLHQTVASGSGRKAVSRTRSHRKRPGRKFMDSAERQIVAERMKRYWAERRAGDLPKPGVEAEAPLIDTPQGVISEA